MLLRSDDRETVTDPAGSRRREGELMRVVIGKLSIKYAWAVFSLIFMIFGMIYSLKGMPIDSNRCCILGILFYMLFISDACLEQFREIKRRLRELENNRKEDSES